MRSGRRITFTAAPPHVVAGLTREEDLVARLDAAGLGSDGSDHARAAIGLRRGGNDQAEVRLRLLIGGLDDDVVVEWFERQVDPACLGLAHDYKIVVWPVTLPGSWVASTKRAAAIVRRQGWLALARASVDARAA